jgi:hypothetical protein
MANTIPVEEIEFGADIASFQGYVHMELLRDLGHSFIISKVTGEGPYVNPYWVRNRENARKASLIFGTYDWVEPQSGMTGAVAAVDYWRVINAPGPLVTGELVTIDFETPEWYTGPLGRNIEPFMRENLFTLSDLAQQPIGIYSATYFLEETGAVDWEWLNDPRFYYWQAAPGSKAMMPDDSYWPATSPPFTRTVIHQHQWHALSGAIVGEYDRDRFWGTKDELLKYGKPGSVSPIVGGDVIEPTAGKVSWYINMNGEPIFVWNMGGKTEKIRGVDIANLGMTVESFTQPGILVGRSIFNGVEQDFQSFPDPEVGAHKVFLGAGNPQVAAFGSSGDAVTRRPPEEFVPDDRKLSKGVPIEEPEE